ncbi:hypothetical protein N0M98_29175 [Paenibacillus doosanensis]|uniref:hypothetical protein n=1 Tax=Paenibacillus doosanensis TaxID=1229154 RepID=UPI00218091A8|nr:hypothetical protein [Paenibacillus doosanensis]MCS7464179.1 hypothetical protein [Paenibacillus doosanensis]
MRPLTENGLTYAGNRQTTTTQEIMTNTPYVISCSYIMPAEMQERQFVLKIVSIRRWRLRRRRRP